MTINIHALHTGFQFFLLYVLRTVGGFGAYGGYGGAGRFYPMAGGLKPAKSGACPVNSQLTHVQSSNYIITIRLSL